MSLSVAVTSVSIVVVFGVLFAAPVPVLPRVFRPWSATLMNAISWTGYGLLVANDPIVWGPNALGLVAACVQMGLFAKYGIHTAPPAGKIAERP